MRETALRIRTFNKFLCRFVDNPSIKYDSPHIIYNRYDPSEIISHYSGVNDSKGTLIYEGDIVKLSGKSSNPYVGVVEMDRMGLNDKVFCLRPCWKKTKTTNPITSSDTEYFILIDTPTNGQNRIHGMFIGGDYPINKENGTGFSIGTISEVIGNVFENEELIPQGYISKIRRHSSEQL